MRISATAVYRPRSSAGQFIASRITPAVTASVQAAAQVILDGSQVLVPVDTGELKASGRMEVDESGRTARVIYDAGHAAYVEFGTGQAGAASAGAGGGPYDPNWPGMAAQPYLRPAYEEAKPVILDLFRSNIATGLGQ